MNADRCRQIDEVFQAALAHPIADRPAYLDRACADDPDLRREVEALLASDEQAVTFIESPAFDLAGALPGDARTPADESEFAAGSIIAHYRIESRLGAGGMGKVYLAQDLRLGRRVALKFLDPVLTRDRQWRTRFRREARLASARNHPNICAVYEISDQTGEPFIAIEYVEGETLENVIKNGALDLLTASDIARQIADALAEAHAHGIIHRDIKPANIIIDRRGRAKILDFGLAKRIGPENAEESLRALSQAGMILGTIAYMSPEQACGKETDARTDIWSFGVVFYEMLTGKRPFTEETTAEMLAAILKTDPLPPSQIKPEIPPAIERIILRSLDKDREKRYPAGFDLLRELQSLSAPTKVSGGLSNVFNASFLHMPPNNLPENLSRVIGREKQIDEIRAYLLHDDVRLLTLTGVGGAGKTRLALAVAANVLPHFPDGVFFAELAALRNPELAALTIAQPLGLKESGSGPILEILKEHLRDKQMLLVIDNFEQVVDARSQLAELLSAAAKLKILVTSRIILNLSTEREFIVPPLAVPSGNRFGNEWPSGVAASDLLGELANYEAIELFVERARRIKSNFSLTPENARCVVEICTRLEGLPLAIELAAARIKILAPQDILGKLENRLRLLTGGSYDLPIRQQTMRSTVEWSYDLLAEQEKILFRRLSVFARGFTLEAAAFVAGDYSSAADPQLNKNESQISAPPDRATADVLDGITSLVNKSLLVAKDQIDNSRRFLMLEVVREYAREALEAAGEADAVRCRHAGYFLALAEEAEPHLQTARAAQWLDTLEVEHDNLRAALDRSLAADPETAVRLAGALRSFWFVHSHLTEGCRWLKAALAVSEGALPPQRFKLVTGLGWIARMQGDYETARALYEKGLDEGRKTNDVRQIALSLRGLGIVTQHQGDLTAARKFYKDALEFTRRSDDKFVSAALLISLGDLALTEGDFLTARPLFEESLTIFRALGDKQGISGNLNNLGAIAYREREYEKARIYYGEALKAARELGEKTNISYSFDGFAAIFVKEGNFALAARLAGCAGQLRESIGYKIEPAERDFRNLYLDELRTVLNAAEFESFYESGQRMEFETAVAQVFDFLPDQSAG